ncbi:putative oxidoreductase [compost metagenome]
MPELLEHIEAGRLNPEAIVTHRIALEDAIRGYEMFDEQQERCRKVIMVPGEAADAVLSVHP